MGPSSHKIEIYRAPGRLTYRSKSVWPPGSAQPPSWWRQQPETHRRLAAGRRRTDNSRHQTATCGQQSVASFLNSQGYVRVSCPADFWMRISAMSLAVMSDNSSFLEATTVKTSTFCLFQHVAHISLGLCGEPKLTETTRGVVRDTTLITDGRGWKKLIALKFLTQCPLFLLVKVGCR